MGKRDPELQITVKKLVTVSLMEVFKDLLPAYQIKHQDVPYNKRQFNVYLIYIFFDTHTQIHTHMIYIGFPNNGSEKSGIFTVLR